MLTTVSAFSFEQARLWGWGTHSVWWKPRCRSGLSDNSDLCQRNLCVYRITYLNNICDFYGHLLLTSVAIHFWQVFAFTCTPCCCLVGRPQRLHRPIFPFSSFSTHSSFPHAYGAMMHVTYNILRQQRHSFLILSLANLAEATPFLSIASRLCKTQRTKIDAEFSLYSINNTRHNSSHIVACEDFSNTNIWEHQSSTFKMLAHNKLWEWKEMEVALPHKLLKNTAYTVVFLLTHI